MLVGSLLAFPAPVQAQVCGDGVIDAGETMRSAEPGAQPRSPVRPSAGSTVRSAAMGSCSPTTWRPATSARMPFARGASRIAMNASSQATGTGGCSCARYPRPRGPPRRHFGGLRVRQRVVAQCLRALRSRQDRCHFPGAHPPPAELRRSNAWRRSACGTHGRSRAAARMPNGRQRCLIKPDAAHCTAPGWIGVARSERGLLRRVSVKVDGWSN